MPSQFEFEDEIIAAVRAAVVPATGCTEPVALAFAAAVAAKNLKEPVESIEAFVSANLMKNGMGVSVPGTGMKGLYIAAAVGALGGDSEKGLEVLDGLDEGAVEAAKKMLAEHRVTLSVSDTPHILYAQAVLKGKNHTAMVCIADSHTDIIRTEYDGKVIFESKEKKVIKSDDKKLWQGLSLREIFNFACKVPLDKISFIEEAARLNDKLSQEGLERPYGLHIGRTLKAAIKRGYVGEDLLNEVTIRTVAASDARMGGAPLPAMTNSGSGNQGITATEPVCAVASFVGATDEDLTRALFLSHSTAVYIHAFLPKLSALCAASTAAMGAAAGMAYLLDGKHRLEVAARAISTMCGDMVGMVCDGAANSCSMKVATACSAAVRAVLLALDDSFVTGDEGLVADAVDETVRNVGKLACQGMKKTDVEILNIMLEKNKKRGF